MSGSPSGSQRSAEEDFDDEDEVSNEGSDVEEVESGSEEELSDEESELPSAEEPRSSPRSPRTPRTPRRSEPAPIKPPKKPKPGRVARLVACACAPVRSALALLGLRIEEIPSRTRAKGWVRFAGCMDGCFSGLRRCGCIPVPKVLPKAEEEHTWVPPAPPVEQKLVWKHAIPLSPYIKVDYEEAVETQAVVPRWAGADQSGKVPRLARVEDPTELRDTERTPGLKSHNAHPMHWHTFQERMVQPGALVSDMRLRSIHFESVRERNRRHELEHALMHGTINTEGEYREAMHLRQERMATTTLRRLRAAEKSGKHIDEFVVQRDKPLTRITDRPVMDVLGVADPGSPRRSPTSGGRSPSARGAKGKFKQV